MNFGNVPRVALATPWCEFTACGFRDPDTGEEALALVSGSLDPNTPTLARIHSQCLTGDVFASNRCDCHDQLHEALRRIEEAGSGVLIYQLQEGRGIGLLNKLRAYQLQDCGLDTVAANEELGFEADHRDYGLPAEILKYLGVRCVRLLSNNPDKVDGLERRGVRVIERIPLEIQPSLRTRAYLRAKKEKLGHLLTQV